VSTVRPVPEPVATPLEEARLVRCAQDGDRTAQAALVERYWNRVHRWLYHLCRDPHHADDLTQETFLRALANLKKFEAGTCLPAWLFRIGHNVFASQARKPHRAERPLPEDLLDPAEGPLERAELTELTRRLESAVAGLSVDFRGALLLRVQEGLSFREIANVLGLTEETARWRVFKARQKLLEVVGADPAQGTD
jgi:RNA polymerase sigma-70 factor (ECF subfamily)